MSFVNLEEEEKIIQSLEELDSTFSNIRSTLKSIKTKISRIASGNKRLCDDCSPWMNFFESGGMQNTSPLSLIHLNSLQFKDVIDSPDIMNVSSPKNPFMDINTSNLLNKSLMKENRSTTISDSSSTLHINKSRYETYESVVNGDSEESSIRLDPFDITKIPEIFQKENDLKYLYDFIELHRTVCLEDICHKFEMMPVEKLKIYISLLCRKNFIKQKGNNLTIEK